MTLIVDLGTPVTRAPVTKNVHVNFGISTVSVLQTNCNNGRISKTEMQPHNTLSVHSRDHQTTGAAHYKSRTDQENAERLASWLKKVSWARNCIFRQPDRISDKIPSDRAFRFWPQIS